MSYYKAKMHQIQLGLSPDPAGKVHSASPDPLDLRGPTSKRKK